MSAPAWDIIARIETPFDQKFGVPRQSGIADCPGRIVFEKPFRDADAVRGLEGFSHIWLIWQFDRALRQGWSPTVRPPRLGGNERVGVFATRSPFRPNGLGLSAVELERVALDEPDSPVLYVRGADMVSGTPILDDNGKQTGLAFTNIMPGTAVTKTPNIENTGTADAYVRAIVTVTIKAADGVTELPTVLRSGAPVVTFNIDGGKWVTKAGEQYYYYNKVLTPGESVDLFSQVTFDPAMGNEYQGCTVTVSIQAQAVQKAHNPMPEEGIFGVSWPADPAE